MYYNAEQKAHAASAAVPGHSEQDAFKGDTPSAPLGPRKQAGHQVTKAGIEICLSPDFENNDRVCDEMDAPVKSASQCAKLIEQQTRFS